MTTFELKSVAELLDGEYNFYIPSYQRGYRWESKQVLDLLEDLAKYAREEYDNLYCLQPLVVQKDQWNAKVNGKDQTIDGWKVIDGQQRLTTLWFILNQLKNEDYSHCQLYNLFYETRPELELSKINESEAKANIDSFYMFNTKCVIETWKNQYLANQGKLGQLRDILFVSSKNTSTNKPNKVAQFIWYELDKGGSTDLISMFNSLNYGRISLTSSELIKALFVLNVDRSFGKSDSLNKHRISAALEVLSEWNLMEQKLQDENFWKFLTNDDYDPPTRIDIIFDFLTNKPKEADKDFSYRKFQDLYDGNTDFWKGVTDFDDVWDKVRDVFYMLLSWYNDLTMCHLIGYLIHNGKSLNVIFDKIRDKQKHEQVSELKNMIKDDLELTKDQLRALTYKEDSNKVRKVVLLFNLITYNNANYRFSFDKFKGESWDIEHLSPQTKNPLTDNKDRLQWLTYANELTSDDTRWPIIISEISDDKLLLEKDIKNSLKDFDQLYESVIEIFQANDFDTEEKIDKIWNLTLLDAGTNRGYGNALFPTKRMKIIEADESMKFVPICTRNMILKYYTKSDGQTSQFKNQWTQDDADAYLEAIVTCLDNSKLLKTDSTVAAEEQQKQ